MTLTIKLALVMFAMTMIDAMAIAQSNECNNLANLEQPCRDGAGVCKVVDDGPGNQSGRMKCIVDCGVPERPTNGNVDYTGGTKHEDVAIYTCDRGYGLIGDPERYCQVNGEWTCTVPECTPVVCGAPGSPTNGNVSVTEAVWYLAIYTCNYGHILIGDSERVCQPNGNWSGEIPTCSRVDCGTPGSLPRGQVGVSTSSPFGDEATYTCQPGFLLVGDSKRHCQSNGQWSGEMPTCSRVDCGTPDSPANGGVFVFEGSSWTGDQASYHCDEGFYMSGSENIVCGSDGQWANDAPTCPPVDCGIPGGPFNGDVQYTGTGFRDEATFRCNDGYAMVTDKAFRTSTCQADGKWVEINPRCTLVNCGAAKSPTNGGVALHGTMYDSVAVYTCDKGYALAGPKLRICTADGMWSGEAPTCIAVCKKLENPSEGRVRVAGPKHSQRAFYVCKTGYALSGEEERLCVKGEWTGEAPTCSFGGCTIPDAPPHGSADYTGTGIGDVVTFSCNDGYAVLMEKGVGDITCQSDGGWSGAVPTCYRDGCDPPDAPTHGNVDYTGTGIGDMATFSCDDGYALEWGEVNVKLFCQSGGDWSGEFPTCSIVVAVCGSLANPPNGYVRVVGPAKDNRLALYSCDAEYVLTGDAERRCEDGKWEGEPPTCNTLLFTD